MSYNYTALSANDKAALAAAFNFLSAEYIFYATLIALALGCVVTIRTLIIAYRNEDALQSIAKTMHKQLEMQQKIATVATEHMMKVMENIIDADEGGTRAQAKFEEAFEEALKRRL